MSDLNSNLQNDVSVSDIQILNTLIHKKPQGQTPSQPKMVHTTQGNNELASVKLFKRMTTLKRENMDLEQENQ